MKTNNKGFTFVEILAAIVLIGVLSSIAIIGVTRYRENAKNKDYEALAKSSSNAMEEYMMAHPYSKKASLETLEEGNYLSNRKDPATKNTDCTGSVEVNNNAGNGQSIDNDDLTVYLCCTNYKKKYTYPGGEITNYTGTEKCDVEDETDPVVPTPPPGETAYTITYVLNGGTVTGNPTSYSASMLPLTLKEPSRDGYNFTGWTEGDETELKTTVTLPKGTTGNKIYTANWTQKTTPTQTYSCPAGKYLPKNKTSCETCLSGYYCPGGGPWKVSTTANQGLKPCPTGYKRSPTGSSRISQCYINVTAGYHIATAKSSTIKPCSKGTYKLAHTVNYGSTSSCKNCPSGYRDGAGTTAQTNCIMNVSKDHYVKKSKDSTASSCSNTYTSDPHKVKYTKTSSCRKYNPKTEGGIYLLCKKNGGSWPGDCSGQYQFGDNYFKIPYNGTTAKSWKIKVAEEGVTIEGLLRVESHAGNTYCFTIKTRKDGKTLHSENCRLVPYRSKYDRTTFKW